MTKNQSKKHAARETARAENINYTAARRMITVVSQLTSRPADQILPAIAAEHFGMNVDQWADRLASIDGTIHRLDFLYSAEGFVGTIEYTSQMSGRNFAPFPRGESDNAVRILNVTVGLHERDERAAILDLIARQRRAGVSIIYTQITADQVGQYRSFGFNTLNAGQAIDFSYTGVPNSFVNPVRSFEARTSTHAGRDIVAYLELDGSMSVTSYEQEKDEHDWDWLWDAISPPDSKTLDDDLRLKLGAAVLFGPNSESMPAGPVIVADRDADMSHFWNRTDDGYDD